MKSINNLVGSCLSVYLYLVLVMAKAEIDTNSCLY